ncbi:MAG: methyltransferase domain-containing protein [Verrucomicrobiae bacterium]|nr:methyltransferase domain-containing protein [Verrucomicrobiae bacterium]
MRRKDVTLRQCRKCGLVFNATFNISAIPYDGNYENRQSFSPAFQAHLDALAANLTQHHNLTGGRILEVGCGKGDFLRLLCATAEARGVGYDTSYEPRTEPRGLTFHKRYVSATDVSAPFDAVICRHVVEHIPEIGAFLGELRDIAKAAGDPVVVLETPRFEWIVEHLSLWDVFYEHCNYFPTASLAHLCRLAGFRVVRHRSVFGSQYQILEVRVAKTGRSPSPPGIPVKARLSRFARHARRHFDALAKQFQRAAGKRGWGVWGAGAKGVALVNHLHGTKPRFVVDSNPAKQGGVLPGSRIPIVSPEDPRLQQVGLIVIANPNYAGEIGGVLQQRGFTGRVLTL